MLARYGYLANKWLVLGMVLTAVLGAALLVTLLPLRAPRMPPSSSPETGYRTRRRLHGGGPRRPEHSAPRWTRDYRDTVTALW